MEMSPFKPYLSPLSMCVPAQDKFNLTSLLLMKCYFCVQLSIDLFFIFLQLFLCFLGSFHYLGSYVIIIFN